MLVNIPNFSRIVFLQVETYWHAYNFCLYRTFVVDEWCCTLSQVLPQNLSIRKKGMPCMVSFPFSLLKNFYLFSYIDVFCLQLDKVVLSSCARHFHLSCSHVQTIIYADLFFCFPTLSWFSHGTSSFFGEVDKWETSACSQCNASSLGMNLFSNKNHKLLYL